MSIVEADIPIYYNITIIHYNYSLYFEDPDQDQDAAYQIIYYVVHYIDIRLRFLFIIINYCNCSYIFIYINIFYYLNLGTL